MFTKTLCFFLILIACISQSLCAQKLLRVNYTQLGIPKKMDYYQNDVFHYKLKGEHFLRTNRIMDFRDTLIFFSEEFSIYFHEIKTIKVYNHSYHNKLFQRFFLIGGIGLPVLYVTNSLMLDYRPLLSTQAAIVSASFLTASFLLKQMGIKRVKMKKNAFIRVLELNYNNFNSP